MDMNKSSDILKDMINKSGKNPNDLLSMNKNELQKRLSGIDKNAAAKKQKRQSYSAYKISKMAHFFTTAIKIIQNILFKNASLNDNKSG